MRVRLLNRRLFSKIFVAAICFVTPMALWVMYGATSFAASRSADGGPSVGLLQQAGTPTPTPGPARTVGWGNRTLPGLTMGLPMTARYPPAGAPAPWLPLFEICSRGAAPSGVHYWLNRTDVPLRVGDPEEPAVIEIAECGTEVDPATTYTITDRNDRVLVLGPSYLGDSVSGLRYEVPPGSPDGPYEVKIASRYGSASFSFWAINNSTPHIYIHDATTGDVQLDPSHGVSVDYVNFAPNSRIPVGLYRDRNDTFELIDAWQISMDSEGRYSEILTPGDSQAMGHYLLMACALEGCLPGYMPNLSIEPVGRQFRLQQPPAQAVRLYYKAINDRDYEASWAMLSNEVRSKLSRTSDLSPDFAKVAARWDTLQEIKVDSLETIAQTPFTATIVAHLSYRMENDATERKIDARIDLTWNSERGIWMLSAIE